MANLNNIKKDNPFQVPDNYFTNFNNKIMSQLPEQEVQKKIVPLWKRFVSVAAIAAMFIGVMVYFGINTNDVTENNSLTSQKNDSNQNVSSSYVEDFYSYIEDEATQAEYYDSFYRE